jgi:hypothetical protein
VRQDPTSNVRQECYSTRAVALGNGFSYTRSKAITDNGLHHGIGAHPGRSLSYRHCLSRVPLTGNFDRQFVLGNEEWEHSAILQQMLEDSGIRFVTHGVTSNQLDLFFVGPRLGNNTGPQYRIALAGPGYDS